MAKSIFCSPIFNSAQGWHFAVRLLLPCPQQPGQMGGRRATGHAVSQGPSSEKGPAPSLPAAPGDIPPGHNGSPHPGNAECDGTK